MNNFDIDPAEGHTYFTPEELANEPVNPMDCTEEEYLRAQLQRKAELAAKHGDDWSDPQWEAHHFEVEMLEDFLAELG